MISRQMGKLHIIQTVFTGRGMPDRYIPPDIEGGLKRESPEWLSDRIRLFKKYTLPSLLNQTNRDFLHWISFRKPDKQILELESYLKDLKYNFVFTYNGSPCWDKWSPNDDLNQRFEKDLLTIEKYRQDWIYFTVLDSDDMFHKDIVAEIQSEKPAFRRALVCQKGYVYNNETGELSEWIPKSPPFYTIIYPAEVFFDVEKWSIYNSSFGSHNDIIRIFSCIFLPTGRYCVVIHKNNKSTIWRHKFKGNKQNKKALANFGIK